MRWALRNRQRAATAGGGKRAAKAEALKRETGGSWRPLRLLRLGLRKQQLRLLLLRLHLLGLLLLQLLQKCLLWLWLARSRDSDGEAKTGVGAAGAAHHARVVSSAAGGVSAARDGARRQLRRGAS